MSHELAVQLEQQAAQLRAAANNAPPIPTFRGMMDMRPQPPPAAPHQAVPQLTPGATALEALIDQSIERKLAARMPPAPPQNATIKDAFMALMQASISPADFTWLQEHLVAGQPGFVQFLDSETLRTLAKFSFENYKEFLEGKTK